MNVQGQNSSGATPYQVLETLTDVEWLCETDKVIASEHHALKLFGFLDPLRATSICIVSENERSRGH